MAQSELVYSMNEAARAASVSGASLRNYTAGGQFGRYYEGLFSPEASPGPGQPRHFTEDDITLVRFIRAQTSAGASHAQIAAKVRAGELAGFTWQPPPQEPGAVPEEAPRRGRRESESSAALALREVGGQLAAQLAGIVTAQLEEAQARARELETQLRESEARAARAEGELTALRAAQARPWYRRLFVG